MSWSKLDSARVFRSVDAVEELGGAGVALLAQDRCKVLRDCKHASGLQTFIVLDALATTELDTTESQVDERSRHILSQLTGLGLPCGGAGLVGRVRIDAGPRAPAASERSAPVAYLRGTAFLATDARAPRCAQRIASSPSALERADVDSEPWYRAMAIALEAVGRLEPAPPLGASLIGSVLEVRSVTGRSCDDVLRRMSPPEKRRIAREMTRLEVPGIGRKKLAASLRLGARAKLYRNHALLPALRFKLLDRLGAVFRAEDAAAATQIRTLGVYLYQEE